MTLLLTSCFFDLSIWWIHSLIKPGHGRRGGTGGVGGVKDGLMEQGRGQRVGSEKGQVEGVSGREKEHLSEPSQFYGSCTD